MSRELKIEAARAALGFVEQSMRLGIGTGSTADEFVRLLAEKVADGFEITGVPTSERTRQLCQELNVPLATLEEMPELDLVVDGADEVDPDLRLIKGAGGALLWEKIVAHASDKMIVIADESKVVDVLGKFPLPIEINEYGLEATRRSIVSASQSLGLSGKLELRKNGEKPYITDGGHLIFDAHWEKIPDAEALSEALLFIPGVVEHGLFLGYANVALIAGANGVRQMGDLQA